MKSIKIFILLFIPTFYSLTSSSCKKVPANVVIPTAGTGVPVVNVDSTLPAGVSKYGTLQVAGNKLLDQHKQPVILRGMSLFWSQWIGKYYTEGTVAWLHKDFQANVVRAAMAVDQNGYLVNAATEKAKVFTVIEAAIKHDMYVIVDWHDHHAEDHLAESKKFFAEVAQKYGKYPNIIYEPYNEPLDVSWTRVLKPYHEAVLTEIRKYDTKNLVVLGTRNWSQRVDDVIGNKVDDPNVAYTLHFYAATHKQGLRDMAESALNANIPPFVTEYGTTEASGDDSINQEEMKLWWVFLEENGISYCNWSIADKVELASALKPNVSPLGNWDVTSLTKSGQMVRTQIRSKN